jgi:[acyl-carrier-protein] S-malonyltransferase
VQRIEQGAAQNRNDLLAQLAVAHEREGALGGQLQQAQQQLAQQRPAELRPTDLQAIRDALARQLYQPVRWVETIHALHARGASTVVECGPGKVLAGLIKRIDPTLVGLPIYDDGSLQEALVST